jgi:hypothetical protein
MTPPLNALTDARTCELLESFPARERIRSSRQPATVTQGQRITGWATAQLSDSSHSRDGKCDAFNAWDDPARSWGASGGQRQQIGRELGPGRPVFVLEENLRFGDARSADASEPPLEIGARVVDSPQP